LKTSKKIITFLRVLGFFCFGFSRSLPRFCSGGHVSSGLVKERISLLYVDDVACFLFESFVFTPDDDVFIWFFDLGFIRDFLAPTPFCLK